jgi:hypothetical protein
MKISRRPSRRTIWETSVACVAAFFSLLAAIWPDWIEAFGVDPDHGNGSLEWAIPIALAVVAVGLGFVARRHWHADAVPITHQ